MYICAPKNYTLTNVIGALGNMESDVVKISSAEAAYFYLSSSQHKYGSWSCAFIQSSSATELTYTLRDASGQRSFYLDNTHKYYFSIWVYQQHSLNITCDCYWPVAEPPVLRGVANTALGQWQQQSAVFTRSGFANGNYPMRIDCNNYPGGNVRMYIDGLMLMDLTEVFGAGNEPDKEWCDANIPFTISTASVTREAPAEVKKIYIGVNGVARKVKKGYIGINGVARMFYSSEASLDDLMADIRIVEDGSGNSLIVGRNSSGRAYLNFNRYPAAAGDYYVFSFCNGYMSISKATYTGASSTGYSNLTTLFQSNASYGNACLYSESIYYSDTGSSRTRVYGATLAVVEFPSYSNDEVDAVLGALTPGMRAGRNSAGYSTVTMACPSVGSYVFVAGSSYMAVNKIIAANTYANLFGNYASNPDLLYGTSTLGYSTSGSSNTSVYGASIVCVTA